MSTNSAAESATPGTTPGSLIRGLGFFQATALNIANMVGVGPFITIPLLLRTLPGPAALLAWIAAAVLILCDGLVWSELGAALPGAGGSYHYLREIFGPYRWGGMMPFLFIWQFLISGTLEIASGYLGGVAYLKYLFPSLESHLASLGLSHGMNCVAAGLCVVVTLLLCRRIDDVGRLGIVLCAGTLVAMVTMIGAGLAHFNPRLLEIPPGSLRLDQHLISGLGAGMLIAIYDYLGYYNICHLGEEVLEPGKTIPRSILVSIGIVGVLYLTMNICIIAVVPWQQASQSENIAALFMEKLFGRGVASAFTLLVLWTAVASVFAMTLGYSRIPYAAARNGDFFPIFARVETRKRYPYFSLLVLGSLTAVFCFFPLDAVIMAAVVVRILVQFIGQIVALHIYRSRVSNALPFRMALYPIPSIVALLGWTFVLATSGTAYLLAGAGVVGSGALVYAIWRGPRSDKDAIL